MDSIEERQAKEKTLLLEHLKKMPIVHIACDKASVGRATYYRWRKEDAEFRKLADAAISEGEAIITDMSESQLISLIKDKKFPALQLWLRTHHPKYTNKVEIIDHSIASDKLSPEQEGFVRDALKLIQLGAAQN